MLFRSFNGTVSNAGNVALANVTVVDEVNGIQTTVLTVPSLAAGASTNYSGSYVPTTTNSTDTVTVTGTVPQFCGGGTVTDSESATCGVTCNPHIKVTKQCQSTAEGLIEFSGIVSNSGNVTLTSVTVKDIVNGTTTTVFAASSLAKGESQPYSGSYAPTTTTSTDNVIAQGTIPAICGGGTVTDTASATCSVAPCIKITKTVACNAGEANCSSLSYGSRAAGATDGVNFPNFCYRFAITNCGDQQIDITNVTDTTFGDITGQGFPSTLLPGASTNVYLTAKLEQSEINIVSLLGVVHNGPSLGGVNSSSTATADVLVSKIACDVLFLQGGRVIDGNSCSNANVGVQVGGGAIQVRVKVCADAANGQNITNASVTVSGLPGGAVTVPVPGILTAGACTEVVVGSLPDAISSFNVHADVSGEGSASHSCGPITTSCENSIEICGVPCLKIYKYVKCLMPEEQGTCGTDLSQIGRAHV